MLPDPLGGRFPTPVITGALPSSGESAQVKSGEKCNGGLLRFRYRQVERREGDCMSEKRPNIVFVLADNVGWGDWSCYGGSTPTPRIDQLAAARPQDAEHRRAYGGR